MQPSSEGRLEARTPEEQFAALCELLTHARRIVRILSDDLAPALFDQEETAGELSRIARQGPPCEVRVLIKDSRHLRGSAHRVGVLHQRLVSSVPLRLLLYRPEHQVANFVLTDENGVLFLPNAAEKLCFWNRDDRAFVRHLIAQFDELWHKSGPDPELRSMTI